MPGGKYASFDNEEGVAGEDIMTVWTVSLLENAFLFRDNCNVLSGK